MRGEDWKQHSSYFIYSQGPLLLSGAAKRKAREINTRCHLLHCQSLHVCIKTTAKIQKGNILVGQNKLANKNSKCK